MTNMEVDSDCKWKCDEKYGQPLCMVGCTKETVLRKMLIK